MFTLIKRISRFENHMDASIERFIFRHKFWGFIIIFIGIPFVTLAAVCICTTIIALSFAFIFGWM